MKKQIDKGGWQHTIMRKTAILTWLLLMACLIPLHAADNSIPNLRHGVLPNGLNYYIYKSSDFAGEVNYYLYQNVGAVVEDDNQNGLAHFMEHLAFEETRNFPNGVMSFLRENNLVFNAQTGSNDTRFYLYNIPTADKALCDSLLLVMHDWCHGIRITPKGVEKQRGIILQEKQQRNTFHTRLSNGIADVVYNHSKYARHNTIGTDDVLKSIDAKGMSKFYDTWYRPDLQCVMIIGDVELDAYEKKIKDVFGKLVMPKKIKARPNIVIENHQQPLFHHFKDKENTNYSVGLYYRHPTSPKPGLESTKHELCTRIFNQLMSRTIGMIRNSGRENFIAATVSYSPLVRGYDQCAWDVVPYEGKAEEALLQLLSLRNGIRHDGFGKEEFEAVKWQLYKQTKALLEDERVGTPDNWYEIFRQHYLYGTPITSLREQLAETAECLVDMEVEDLNGWIKGWMNDNNLAVVSYTTNAQQTVFNQEMLNALSAKAAAQPTIGLSVAVKPIDKLIDYTLTPGRVVSVKPIPQFEAKEWKLSNGAVLRYKHLPTSDGQFMLDATIKGGRSIVADKDLASFSAMRSLIMQSGVHHYDRNRLHHWLQHKQLDLSIYLDDYFSGIRATAVPADAENLFAYINLVLTRQNFSEDVFRKFVERKVYLYNSRNNDGMTAVQDSINRLLFPPSASNPTEDLSFYRSMKHEDLPRLFAQQFGDASQYVFTLVGDLSEEQARQLAEKYLANLPTVENSKPREAKELDFSSKQQEIKRVFTVERQGEEAEIEIAYTHDLQLSVKEEKALEIFRTMLEQRYFSELREKEAATYSIGVEFGYKEVPQPRASLNIHFSTSNGKAEAMTKKVYDILTAMSKGEFSTDEFKKVQVPMAADEMSRHDTASDAELTPQMWATLLAVYTDNAPSESKDEAEHENVSVADITPADVSNVARKFLEDARHRQFTVLSHPLAEQTWERLNEAK
ncbi:MAG: insulinase family protein [Prevotella sp.]|nr:insulinase family protein [Prevotella sp.]